MSSLERAIVWMIYFAALEAQKKLKHRHLTLKRGWVVSRNAVREALAAEGLTL